MSDTASEHVVHDSTVETVVIHGEERAEVRRDVVELTGSVPLFAVRSRRPSGATRAPVILIHGFAQNRYSWHTNVRSISAYLANEGWDVWNLELRGHGRSRTGTDGRAQQYSDYIADIVRFAQHLPEPAFWVGHSLGASVAYAGAAKQIASATPRGVIGIGGVYQFAQQGHLLPAICKIAHHLPKSRWTESIQINTRISGAILTRFFPLLDAAAYWSPISGWWPGSVEPALTVERMSLGFDWIPVRIWHEMAEWGFANQVPWDAAWRQTDVPLFVVLGDKDSMQFPEDGRTAFDRSNSADKTLRIFNLADDGFHWGHLDLVLGKHAPAHVWPAIHAWMAPR